MPFIRQTSFSAGELAPLLWGRTDLPAFARGLRRCRDFIISRQGAAVSRPGTEYIAPTKDSGNARLIPFTFSDTVSYVLEFGDEYVRVYSYGSLVDEVVTPYQGYDTRQLQYAQTGDILTLTHPSYPPKELRRNGHVDWELVDVDYAHPAPSWRDPADPTIAVSAPGLVPTAPATAALPTADADHPAREWIWKTTIVYQDTATGRFYETLPATTTVYSDTAYAYVTLTSNLHALYPDKAMTLRLDPTGAPPVVVPGMEDWRVVGFNVYRGSGELFGFVGHTTGLEFVDVGDEPDYSLQPPLGTNPFEVHDFEGDLVRTEEPAAVAFFQERRVFGGTTERPETLFFSATGDYFNFDEHIYLVKSQALQYFLAGRRRENIRSLLSLSHLLVFTNSCVWSIGGAGGEGIGPTSVDLRCIDEVGANHMPPLVLDGYALYARSKGSGVRGLSYENERGGFAGFDLSANASHFFLGEDKALVEWAYAEDPWGLVWAVRDDGALLSLSFNPAENAYAWALHETDGQVESVCAVPEGDEDAVYLVVHRNIDGEGVRYIERMTSRVQKGELVDDVWVADPYDDICVDSAGSVQQEEPALLLEGLEHLEGKAVYVIGKDNPVQGPYTVTDGAVTLDVLPIANVAFDGATVLLHVGLLYQPELETLDLAQADVRTRQKAVKEVAVEVVASKGLEAGPSFSKLTAWRQRSTSDSYGAIGLATDVVRVPVTSTYGLGGRACIRQTLPLPLTVVGVTREVDVGG